MDAAGVTALIFVFAMLVGTPVFFAVTTILAARSKDAAHSTDT